MRLLAVSIRYPTLFQTWFINYLESLERIGVNVSVASLFEGENLTPPKSYTIRTQTAWPAKQGLAKDLLRFLTYIFAHLHNKETYKFVSLCFTHSDSIKDFLRRLLLLPGITLDPDIVHCHSEKAAFRLLPLLIYFNAPIVLTFHGLAPVGVPDLDAHRRKKLYQHLECVFVNTKFARDQCRRLVDIKFKTKILPQGINLSNFPFRPKVHSNEEHLKLLSVGRLDRLKGYQFAIEAVRLLSQNGINVKYSIVGDGLYKKTLFDIIESLNLTNQVHILGPIFGADLISVYRSSHIFLLPSLEDPLSWAETQGIVIQEAQASGLLTIATNTGGIPECIIDGETGFLVEQKNPGAIADKVVYLLNNQDKWSEWQIAARKHVENHFDYRDMGSRLVSAYNEILSNNAL